MKLNIRKNFPTVRATSLWRSLPCETLDALFTWESQSWAGQGVLRGTIPKKPLRLIFFSEVPKALRECESCSGFEGSSCSLVSLVSEAPSLCCFMRLKILRWNTRLLSRYTSPGCCKRRRLCEHAGARQWLLHPNRTHSFFSQKFLSTLLYFSSQ